MLCMIARPAEGPRKLHQTGARAKPAASGAAASSAALRGAQSWL